MRVHAKKLDQGVLDYFNQLFDTTGGNASTATTNAKTAPQIPPTLKEPWDTNVHEKTIATKIKNAAFSYLFGERPFALKTLKDANTLNSQQEPSQQFSEQSISTKYKGAFNTFRNDLKNKEFKQKVSDLKKSAEHVALLYALSRKNKTETIESKIQETQDKVNALRHAIEQDEAYKSLATTQHLDSIAGKTPEENFQIHKAKTGHAVASHKKIQHKLDKKREHIKEIESLAKRTAAYQATGNTALAQTAQQKTNDARDAFMANPLFKDKELVQTWMDAVSANEVAGNTELHKEHTDKVLASCRKVYAKSTKPKSNENNSAGETPQHPEPPMVVPLETDEPSQSEEIILGVPKNFDTEACLQEIEENQQHNPYTQG